MKVVVTGGAGFLGRRICLSLEKKGHIAIPMAMEGEDATGLKGVIRGDITDASSFEFPQCDAVIHCAGILESSHPTDELLFKVNYQGTKNVHEKALKGGSERFIFISTISAVGPWGRKDVPMTESMKPSPADPYGRSKLEAERYLENFAGSKKMVVTILRPSVLYGPGMNLNSSGMKTFTSIRKGIMPLVGKGDHIFNMLYVDNLVKAIVLSLEKNENFAIFHVSEGPYTQREVIKTIEVAMGKMGHRRYPKPLLYLMTLIAELVKPLLKGPPPLSWMKYRALTTDIWNMSSDKIRKDLDFNEDTSLEDGVAITCEHYGWLKKK